MHHLGFLYLPVGVSLSGGNLCSYRYLPHFLFRMMASSLSGLLSVCSIRDRNKAKELAGCDWVCWVFVHFARVPCTLIV